MEEHIVHVCRKLIDCTRLALLGALSPRKRTHPLFAPHARCISLTRTLAACVGYHSERGGYLSRASPIFRCTSASASAGSNGGRNT